ncbi:MAG: hypothetical protein AVDCRST_MAG33-1470 [uncultured Thermomicrobiales bacterium]|uniref:Uncharacterized protein n=1 Tax=uncultured Thermomicrobiales bacterium TaxID=1645740 RepID=A0A6J4USD2_9BACT|nr:MAG: hypothetical protein AVDCRST_MAG33-1470 [uncultured Thermomicrobiales bacterium]
MFVSSSQPPCLTRSVLPRLTGQPRQVATAQPGNIPVVDPTRTRLDRSD